MGSSDRQAAVAAEGSLRLGSSRGVEPLRAVAGIGGGDKMVHVYDAKTFEVKWPLRGHTDVVESVCISSDGKLTSGSEDSTVRNWNPATRASLS